MRLISLAMLTKDMVLAQPIYHAEKLILQAGVNDINRFAKGLQKLGIDLIYVEDKLSEGIEIPDVISDETRIKCKKVLKDTIDNIAINRKMDTEKISDVANNVIDEIIMNRDVQVSLNDISVADDYTLAHSVSTAVYAIIIAKELNYSKSIMHKLAIGALLHDIGKVSLDRDIIFKQDQLNDEEYEYVKQHSVVGYEMLKRCDNITELSRMIALTHHERMNGTGYPAGMMGNKLHEFSKITAIADVYDALTSDRCYRKKWPAHKAAQYLLEQSEKQFDTHLLTIFFKQIALFPNGSLVRLSNNKIGLVERQNKSMPLRPVIRVIANEDGRKIEATLLDLMENLSVTIVQSEIELQNIEIK